MVRATADCAQPLPGRWRKDEPRIDRTFTRFLARAYKSKEITDYGVGPRAVVTAAEAQQMIELVTRFVDRIIETLCSGGDLVSVGDSITVELVPRATDDVRSLIAELDQVLSAEYPPEQRHGLALDAIFKPNIRFFLARLNGVAVGCGGVALFDDFAEVKRMYVRDEARGRGVAQALLARIERETRDAGLSLLRLETGIRQTAALRFYQRVGFASCMAFGAYAGMAPQAIATSVFFEKQLAAG